MTWLEGWNKRIKLTVDGSKVDGTLTDFPVMIALSSGTGITGVDTSDVFNELSATTSGVIDSYTKLLLHTEGDASASNHTVTMNGNPKLYPNTGKFKGCMYFDGSDYLRGDLGSDVFGTGDFTIDFWIYPTSLYDFISIFSTTRGAGGFNFGTDGSGKLAFYSSGARQLDSASGKIVVGKWQHVSCTRSGTSLKGYVDGIEVASNTNSENFSQATFTIGRLDDTGENYTGYIDELRLSKGVSRWNSTFSGSLPTMPYTSSSGIDSYTKLMYHFDGDASNGCHSMEFNGDMDWDRTTSKFSYGSYYFDGSGDYISIPDNADFDFGSGDFTVDFWAYGLSGNGGVLQIADSTSYSSVFGQAGTNLTFTMSSNGSSWDIANDVSMGTAPGSNWVHYAVTRSGTQWYTFRNGTQVSNFTSSSAVYKPTGAAQIGRYRATNNTLYYTTGYISELRVSKGICRWNSDFTPLEVPYCDMQGIAVATTAAVQCPVEISYWDSSNRTACLWTKLPTLSSGTNTDFYLYYDKDQLDNSTYVGTTGTPPARNVWDSDYKSVWHLHQVPDGTNSITDSTVNTIAGTTYNMDATNVISGTTTKAFNFNGSDEYIDFGNPQALKITENVTVEVLFKTSDSTALLFGNSSYTDPGSQSYSIGITPKIDWFINAPDDQSLASTTSVNDNVLRTVSTTYERLGGSNNQKVYLNGVNDGQRTPGSSSITTSNGTFKMATLHGSGSYWYAGMASETRVSNTVRSVPWMKATHYSSINSFLTFGSPESSVFFIFTNESPTDLSRYYESTALVGVTLTVSGSVGPDSIYDISFYTDSDVQIGSTISGVDNGEHSTSTSGINTSSGITYSWYATAMCSGFEGVSDTYSFTRWYLCGGYTEINGSRASGVPVRLYRRSDGSFVDSTVSAGVSGVFSIDSPYNEYHYAVAIYPSGVDTNALIYDLLLP